MTNKVLSDFLDSWNDNETRIKEAYIRFKDFASNLSGVSLHFKSRPGVTYSLRAKHENQTDRELFVMIDVIDSDPDARWISMCFYGDLVTDPEGKGDLIPGGLMGADGYCFDLDDWGEDNIKYLEARLKEAAENSA